MDYQYNLIESIKLVATSIMAKKDYDTFSELEDIQKTASKFKNLPGKYLMYTAKEILKVIENDLEYTCEFQILNNSYNLFKSYLSSLRQ